jgi:hypothetical protein
METISNEEKAKTLVDGLGIIYTDCNRVTIKKLLIKMAEWKDEQFAKEKQQLIERVVDWLNKYLFYLDKKDDIINNCIKAMK